MAMEREDRLIEKILVHAERQTPRNPSELFIARLDAQLKLAKMRTHRRLWISIAALLPVAVCVGYFAFFNNYATATAIEGLVYVNGALLHKGGKIHERAVIETKENSYVIADFGTARLLLEPEAKVVLAHLKGIVKPTIMLEQERGATFSYIEPGKALYSIQAGAMTYRVIGTAFAIDQDPPQLTVLHGTVEVKKGEHAARVTANSAPEVLTQLARREAVLQSGELARFANTEAQRRWSLHEIRARYGKLARVETTDGKTYTGGFRTRDKILSIRTETELVKLPTTKIKKIVLIDAK